MDKEILELLKSINTRLDTIEANQEELKAEQKETNKRLDKIEANQEELKAEQKETNKRLDDILKGIGKLVSNEIGESISAIKTDVKFIKRKVQDTEEDVFVIQDHLKLIK